MPILAPLIKDSSSPFGPRFIGGLPWHDVLFHRHREMVGVFLAGGEVCVSNWTAVGCPSESCCSEGLGLAWEALGILRHFDEGVGLAIIGGYFHITLN